MGGPAFDVVHAMALKDIPKMDANESEKNSNTYLKDFIFSRVEGKEMTSGLFRMWAGPALQYQYTYEEIKFIVEGSFILTDGTGQKVTVTKGDVVYFPKGCDVTFETEYYGLGCFTGQRKEGEEDTGEDVTELASTAKFTVHKQITNKMLTKMTANESEKESETYLDDIVTSPIEGKSMVSGLFRMMAGKPLQYCYDYEEIKYIVEGSFILTDGTGQKVQVFAGDIVHFPDGCDVTFETPYYALGCFCGQRKWGEA